MKGHKKYNTTLRNKRKRFIMGIISYIFLVIGTVLLVKEGCLLGEISILGLAYFPVIGYLLAALGFLGINIPPYLKVISQIDKVNHLCGLFRIPLYRVLKSSRLVEMMNKGQVVPLIMMGICSILYPYWVMMLSGCIYVRFGNSEMLGVLGILSVLMCLFYVIYWRRMNILYGVTKCCKPLFKYADSIKRKR